MKNIGGLFVLAMLAMPGLACGLGPSLNPSDIVSSFLPATSTATLVPASPTLSRPPATATTVAPVGTSTVAAATATAASAVPLYDGQWTGTSESIVGSPAPLNFSIKGTKIESANINWSIKVGNCSIGGGFSSPPKDSAITGNSFVAHLNDGGLDFTFAGTFNSATDASGTISYQGKNDFCGAVAPAQVKWSAKKEGSVPSAASPAATTSARSTTATSASARPSPGSASSQNPGDTVRAFFAAVNAKSLDAAMQFVNDDVVFNIGNGSISGIGKAGLRTYLQSQISAGVFYAADNFSGASDIVNFSIKVSNNSTLSSGGVIMDNGKLSIFRLQ